MDTAARVVVENPQQNSTSRRWFALVILCKVELALTSPEPRSEEPARHLHRAAKSRPKVRIQMPMAKRQTWTAAAAHSSPTA